MNQALVSKTRRRAALVLACVAGLAGAPAAARTFHTNYIFSADLYGTMPFGPEGKLVADAQGRLYGTTVGGYVPGSGSTTVYRLTASTSKSAPWTIEVLHSFTSAEGTPVGGVVLGASGEIYGTTQSGGTYGRGTIFRLDNVPGWPITVLHNFGEVSDGETPQSTLALGRDGLLYGTTYSGGNYGVGTAFQVSPQGDQVSYSVIHSFGAAGDGWYPRGDIVMSGDGAIHGTVNDQDYNSGISCIDKASSPAGRRVCYRGPDYVFELAPHHGEFTETLIYQVDQGYLSSLDRGANGDLIACSYSNNDSGKAIRLSRPSAGMSPQWVETDLFQFGDDIGGCSSLTLNPNGGFVGTSQGFDDAKGQSAVFSLTPSSDHGSYTSTVVHTFQGLFELDEFELVQGALLRQGGLYYGVTGGETGSGGTVYDVRP